METNTCILQSIGQFLDWVIKVGMIVTFFVIAYRIKVIMIVVSTYAKNELDKPVNLKHIICSDPKCKNEFDINPLKTKEKGKTICPKCREIISFE
jgi:hypothetical protein